ncbi:hypothetical protein N7533_005796 [Penicillium manginii]|uniref:uncharacterized protein n=1 Tax=Penicillium manginii TaxID=203109 RepID=UPI00254715E4|nr:uncharacterized protein N7533_005796 [Penicillium manginii]KAJ5756253.1 hypothetical protein N7533_005796 [Penicillium manginii]
MLRFDYSSRYLEGLNPRDLLLLISSTILVLWVFYKIEIHPRFISPLRHLPAPKGGYPFIGYGLIRFKKPIGPDYLKFMDEIPNDGLIRYRGFFNRNNILLTSPKALSEVLAKRPYDFEKPPGDRAFMRRVLGDGLVTSEGDIHKFQRKRLLPMFNFRNIKALYPVFLKKSARLVQEIEKSDPAMDSVIDINSWATKVTLDIIGIAGIGRDFDTLSDTGDSLAKTYDHVLEPSFEKLLILSMMNLGLDWLIRFIPGNIDKKFTKGTDSLREICYQFIREKRESQKGSREETTDILSKLMDTNEFSDEELVDQLLTFIAAGHETTSSTLTWLVYVLASDKELQSSLRREIQNCFPEDLLKNENGDVQVGAVLESLPLLNGICNETMRLYPTVPLSMRTPNKDTTILGHSVPKGTEPERWIDADTGKPNNTGGAISNYAVMTFLQGVHMCIGQSFAKAELRALVVTLVRAFEIGLAYPERPVIPAGIITTKPEGGMWIKLKRVEECFYAQD